VILHKVSSDSVFHITRARLEYRQTLKMSLEITFARCSLAAKFNEAWKQG